MKTYFYNHKYCYCYSWKSENYRESTQEKKKEDYQQYSVQEAIEKMFISQYWKKYYLIAPKLFRILGAPIIFSPTVDG